MKVLLTGAAGFIGMHVALRLLSRGDTVIGIDNLNDYYEVGLKQARLALLRERASQTGAGGFFFDVMDVADTSAVACLFQRERPERVVHLAAQAGVRYSITNPQAYARSNLAGFLNVLEGCRQSGCGHLVYASSSSVYGGNSTVPFSEQHNVDHPVSLYAATKKANELMAHSYSHLFALPTTGLRFFTVYGPWGRPDMAPMLFAQAILAGRSIQVFNHGNMSRDFTFVDDVAHGVVLALDKPATGDARYDPSHPNPGTSHAPYRIFNIGNSEPVGLMDFIAELERALGRQAIKQFLPMQAGDVPATSAHVDALHEWVGFRPYTPLSQGIEKFAAWYRSHVAA